MANDLIKLLLMLGTSAGGYAGRERQIGIEDEGRARQKTFDQITLDRAAREKADYEREQAAPTDFANWMKSNPGAPGYVQRPEEAMFPGMPTDITTGGSGRYTSKSPFPGGSPATPAGPAAQPWQNEEEAFRALISSGLSPEAMALAEQRLRMGLPSESEMRQKLLQGREDELITMPDGKQIERWRRDEYLKLNPDLLKGKASRTELDDFNALAGQYEYPLAMLGITRDELYSKYKSLDAHVEALKYKEGAAIPGKLQLGQQAAAKFMEPMPGEYQPIGYNARLQGLAKGLPIPRGPSQPAEITRERALRELAGLDPVARAEAERELEPSFVAREKAAAEAAKRETPILEYRLDETGQPYKIQTGYGTVSEANTALRESLKAIGLPSTIEGREARTDYTKAKTDTENWKKTTLFEANENWRRAQITLRNRGFDQQANDADRRYSLATKQFNQDVKEWQEGFGQKKANDAWNRFVDSRNILDRPAKNVAGVLKAYIDTLTKQKDKLLKDWQDGYEESEGGGFLGIGGKKVKYSLSGLTEDEIISKLKQIDGSLDKALSEYNIRIGEMYGSASSAPLKPGQVPPLSPRFEGPMPPLTGTEAGLPKITPKVPMPPLTGTEAGLPKITPKVPMPPLTGTEAGLPKITPKVPMSDKIATQIKDLWDMTRPKSDFEEWDFDTGKVNNDGPIFSNIQAKYVDPAHKRVGGKVAAQIARNVLNEKLRLFERGKLAYNGIQPEWIKDFEKRVKAEEAKQRGGAQSAKQPAQSKPASKGSGSGFMEREFRAEGKAAGYTGEDLEIYVRSRMKSAGY